MSTPAIRAQKDERALALRSEGLTFFQIGQEMGESADTAWCRCNRDTVDKRVARRRQRQSEQPKPAPVSTVGTRAKPCSCENPVTYREEDDELRCLTCGRGVR